MDYLTRPSGTRSSSRISKPVAARPLRTRYRTVVPRSSKTRRVGHSHWLCHCPFYSHRPRSMGTPFPYNFDYRAFWRLPGKLGFNWPYAGTRRAGVLSSGCNRWSPSFGGRGLAGGACCTACSASVAANARQPARGRDWPCPYAFLWNGLRGRRHPCRNWPHQHVVLSAISVPTYLLALRPTPHYQARA